MSDSRHPLLILPEPVQAEPDGRAGFPPRQIKRPAHQDQAARLESKFQRLQDALEGKRLALQDSLLGIQPEQVLVLETLGSIQKFVNAINRMRGLEWLAEYDVRDIEPEHGFAYSDDPTKKLDGQLFLIMTDQKALHELHRMFRKWKKQPDMKFPYGLAPFKQAFRYLKEIRPWGIADRIRETHVVENWKNRLEHEQDAIPFEIELWHRETGNRRDEAARFLRSQINLMGGTVLQQSVISDIAYHGILGRLPASEIQRIIDQLEDDVPDVRLLAVDHIMYVRPVGQCAIRIPDLAEPTQVVEAAPTNTPQRDAKPVAALFDGMPLTRHRMCADRLVVDDPDGYADSYQAGDRRHGTEMTSLICHGDLSRRATPLLTPLYVRPIMKPVRGRDGVREQIPEDVLLVDLVHRAVRRMYESEDDQPAAAPTVRFINLSIGDPARPFFREMSAWARLLDWLSWKYQVLFVVSAGNVTDDIELRVPTESLSKCRPEDTARVVVSAITADTRNRRILAPAETLNGLSVGAAHHDDSGVVSRQHADAFEFLAPDGPSPISRHGPGYRRALKPEILVPGGRQMMASKIPMPSNRVLRVLPSKRPPGQAVATPGTRGMLNEKAYTKGTSNAAALATRQAVALHEMLNGLQDVTGGRLRTDCEAVLVKALLVHGAAWGDAADVYESVLKARHGGQAGKERMGCFLGYGAADFDKVKSCTAQRVTVLGFGKLDNGDAHRFSLPIPPSLSGRAQHRRLTVTLAWLTPVASTRQRYRIARLWFSCPKDLADDRDVSAGHYAVRRGTVQHEIFEGRKAVPFADGDKVEITVSCRADATDDLPGPVRYGLAVSLEVAEDVDIPIYQEVRERLHVRVRTPRP